MTDRDPPSPRWPAAAPLAGLLVLAPLSLGGTRPAAQVALAGLAALAIGALARRRGLAMSPWLWPPLILAAWGALQCLPLPPAIWRALSPGSIDWRAGWAPISLDVPATVVATLHQAAFALVAVGAYTAGRRDRRWLLGALTGGAGLVAALAVAHRALGAERFLGLVAPLDRPSLADALGPFVNPNTGAGFLVLGAAIALGRVAGARTDTGRRRAAIAGVLAAGGVVLGGSRGGQAALVLAALVFGALALTHRGRIGEESARRARAVATGGALGAVGAITAAVLLLPGWGADPRLDGRWTTWREALGLLDWSWPAGVGRGAFAVVFPSAQGTPVDGTATHPETIGLHLAIEWGAPAALLALAGGVGAWIAALRRARRRFDPVRWGLLAGLAAVGAQQLVDFGFEAMGLSLPVAAALGLALAEPGPAEARRPARPGLLAALALALAAALAGPWAVRHGADADARRIAEAEDPPAIEAAAAAAMARHPADGLAPLTAAARLAAAGGRLDAILAHVDAALARAPLDHRPYLLAARVLRAAGRPAQAAEAYRAAIERAPWRALPLVREAAALADPFDLAAAVPPDERRRLGEVLLSSGRPADARAAMDAILLVEPADAAARLIRGRACLALGDGACAEADAAWLVARGDPAGRGLRARAALAAGDLPRAQREADAALSAAPGEPAALRLAAEIAGARGDLPAARAHYAALFRRVGARPAEAAAVLATWGRLERRAGDAARGRRMLRQAADLDPQYAAEAHAAEEAR